MRQIGIYEIVNTLNNKRYVGSALNMERRWHKHRSELRKNRHHSAHLQSSWNKYGEEVFVFRVVEVCRRDVLLEREQFHIDQGCEYNKARTAGSPLGVKHGAESRARMSASRRGVPKTAKHVASMSEATKKQWADPEAKARRAAAIKANWAKRKAEGYVHPPLTEEQRARMREGVKRSYTPELRERRSKDNYERWARVKRQAAEEATA